MHSACIYLSMQQHFVQQWCRSVKDPEAQELCDVGQGRGSYGATSRHHAEEPGDGGHVEFAFRDF